MKTRQFIILCLLIVVVEPLICYFMFGYLNQYIRYDLTEVKKDTERTRTTTNVIDWFIEEELNCRKWY